MRAGTYLKPQYGGPGDPKVARVNHLSRTTFVDAPFSGVIEYVADFFDERPHLQVKALASADVAVETQSERVEDRLDTVRRHEALTLSWQPRWSIFPSFRGRVTVRPKAPGSELALEGSYEPPGGAIGRIFDRLIGERLAFGTIDHLLDRLRHYVEHRHHAFQQSCPTVGDLNEVKQNLAPPTVKFPPLQLPPLEDHDA